MISYTVFTRGVITTLNFSNVLLLWSGRNLLHVYKANISPECSKGSSLMAYFEKFHHITHAFTKPTEKERL